MIFPWNKYPNTDFHELNLSWVIQTVKLLGEKVDNFINFNSIKYADPIAWNITTQYEANTVVIDPATGIAYLSTQAVPNGVAITNTDYWTAIFDLSVFISAGIVTLSQYGGKVDGVTDDTAALQNAINNGNIVIIDGDTVINGTLTCDNKIIISPNHLIKTTSGIVFTGNSNTISLNVEFSGNMGLLVTGDNNIIEKSEIYRDVKVSGNTMQYSYYCLSVGGNHSTIDKVTVYNGQNGITISGKYLTLKNSYVHDVFTGVIVDGYSEDCIISNNTIKDVDVYRVSGADGILALEPIFRLKILDNNIDTCSEHGMYVQSTNAIITNNNVSGAGDVGIKLASYEDRIPGFYNEDSIVKNNILKNNAGCDVYLQNTCIRTIVENNQCLSEIQYSIRSVDVIGQNYQPNEDLKIINNNCKGAIQVIAKGKLNVTGNYCTNLSTGIQTGGSPLTEIIIADNVLSGPANILTGTVDTKIINNIGKDFTIRGNVTADVIGNTFEYNDTIFNPRFCRKISHNIIKLINSYIEPDQAVPIEEFSHNTVICSGTITVPAWVKDRWSTTTKGTIMIGNKITGCGSTKAIDIYADYSIGIGNMTDSSASPAFHFRGTNDSTGNNIILP